MGWVRLDWSGLLKLKILKNLNIKINKNLHGIQNQIQIVKQLINKQHDIMFEYLSTYF